jgi:hypothetical protein
LVEQHEGSTGLREQIGLAAAGRGGSRAWHGGRAGEGCCSGGSSRRRRALLRDSLRCSLSLSGGFRRGRHGNWLCLLSKRCSGLFRSRFFSNSGGRLEERLGSCSLLNWGSNIIG